MANFRRRRPRGKSSPHYNKRAAEVPHIPLRWMGNWPAAWDLIYHTRPERRAAARVTSAVLRGIVDADDAAWPVPKKPHKYYW